jgi:exodeoxyribonuclease X
MKRIRVIDIETTGLEPPAAAICEIGWCDVVSIDGGPWVVHGPADAVLVNPGHPIPPEISAIHHIVDEDVADAVTLEFVAPDIYGPGLTLDALCAHQAKFERAFITDEMTGGRPWVCTYKCALRLWPDAPSHSNQALRYWRRPAGLDRELAALSHRAGPDAYVTAHHLRDMLNGGALLEHMIKRSTQPALQVTCHIGKNNGKKWREVDTGFLEWMLGKDFDEDALYTARFELDRRAKEAVKA